MGLRRNRSSKPYKREDLEIFNLLEHPVWVFDITGKAMWWANESALELWNAESLESLLQRNFAHDMSESTERRLAEYLAKFQQGGSVTDQWTYYPQGKGATTVDVTLSGITAVLNDDEDDGDCRLMMLNEGVIPIQEEVNQEALRGVEMLRHLPVAVCQFDLEGTLMSQNPESLELFGSPAAVLSDNEESLCSFTSRFVDHGIAQRALEKVLQDKDYSLEAQQKTQRDGLRWFSISLRLSKDPVTSQPVVLYSARDTTEVIQAKKDADRANQEKSEFLAVMAHELRTPLHQMIGFTELLSETTMTDSQLEYVQLMQSASWSLKVVMNDIIEYKKIDSPSLEKIPFKVKGVLEGCRQVILPRTTEKGLTLSCEWERLAESLTLLGNPNRLRQVLLRLLQNSINFTHSGTVSLSATLVNTPDESADTRVRFQVTDTGVGISNEERAQLLGQQSPQANANRRRFSGAGLGLTICKSLVEAMGGTMEVESALGQGTTVSFEVPFTAAVVEKQQPIATPCQQPVQTESTSSLRVLVAEDNKLNQKVIKAMLQRMGHTVTLADNGALAVAAVEENKSNLFDVLLVDHQMPVMDGVEATKVLRSKGYCESLLPVIGLTASYQPSEMQFYRDCGMNDCIGKPARLQTLKQILADVLKQKEGACTSCGGINHHHEQTERHPPSYRQTCI
ncbi:sensor kinase/phosphatase LuxQ [Seminavis robusta]|uniref:histidine kinase n=1 Tax=Seminavis robusta TaxID=568900 RepID=A0A9N8EW69_9STRA|nr:sensor kinase/phosphatase LuxQ [Seminavis robusta]|eukprot:Sro1786_g297450.1 sensor kinase/phosphatase LuxQ (680) ;mRNA; f:16970-19009